MGKVGKIVIAVAAIAAIVALNYFVPGAGALGLSKFLIVAIGSAIITIGSQLLIAALYKPRAPAIDESKVNVRLGEPPRYLNAGRALQGGGVLFGEFDNAGNLWYIIVHSDSILQSGYTYRLDDVEVTLDGSGNVITSDFCLNKKYDAYRPGDSLRRTYFQLWTTTYTESNPTPAGVAALTAAFGSKWDSDHKLVGTTFTVVRCGPVKIEDRYKVYRWRGPLGLGEPNIAIVGDWSNMYDPRDSSQTLGNRSTYKKSRNSALIWAWFRTHPFGRNKPESSINWAKVAEQANICDQSVVGIQGTQKRYECGTAIVDTKERYIAEQEILMSCDGQIVFDEDGKTWPRVGYYYAPTLNLTRNRDIVAMNSVEAQNGESETQGVIVRYLEPTEGYAARPSAPWYNPNYYEPGTAATFLTVDILTCQNHNQAMRLAKSIGMRSQPVHKIAPTVSLRGLRAMGERIVNITYDNVFAGDYEIATPIEVDPSGLLCGMGLVPVNASRFTLLSGEEKPLPALGSVIVTPDIDSPVNVVVVYNNGRLEATFDPPSRGDVTYEFQYIAAADVGSGLWSNMTVQMADNFAFSGPVNSAVAQLVRWQGRNAAGYVTEFGIPVLIGAYSGALTPVVLSSWVVEITAGMTVVSINGAGILTITNHTRRYSDGHPDVAVNGATISTGLVEGDSRSIGYDDPDRVGGAVTYNIYTDDNDAHASDANPARHYMGFITVPAVGAPPSGGGGGGVGGGKTNTSY